MKNGLRALAILRASSGLDDTAIAVTRLEINEAIIFTDMMVLSLATNIHLQNRRMSAACKSFTKHL